MALKIVTGGTTGSADGTLVSSSNKIVFTAIDTVVDAHIRADDDTYSADASFTMPSDGAVQVSFDGGSTWKALATNPNSYGVDIGDLNVAIKLRQHANATASTGTFQTDATTPAATALGQVVGLTVNPFSATQLDLSWTALANRTYYKIERALDSGFSSGLTTLTSTATATTYSDTGLTTGTTYWYRITGIGTVRYSTGTPSTGVSGVPAATETFDEQFSGSSIDTAKFGVIAAGTHSETVSGGLLTLNDGGSASDVCGVYVKPKIPTSGVRKYKIKAATPNAVADGVTTQQILVVPHGSSGFTPSSTGQLSSAPLSIRIQPTNVSGVQGVHVFYWNATGGGAKQYDGSAWVTYSGTGRAFATGTLLQYHTVELEIDNPNSRWRVNAWDQSNASLGSTAWVNFSDTLGFAGSEDRWVAIGDIFSDWQADSDTVVDYVTVT